jgi:dynein heavy chain, axonemal
MLRHTCTDSCRVHAGLDNNLAASPAPWRAVHDAAEPHKAPFPAHFRALGSFEKLLVVRVLRPDKVLPAVRDVVAEHMGAQFCSPPPFALSACYSDSSPTAPLVFVLSAGSDPTAALLQFAAQREMDSRMHAISLGARRCPPHACVHWARGAARRMHALHA